MRLKAGDGGFLYACGELAAAKQEEIPLTARIFCIAMVNADTSRGQPAAFFQVAKLTRDVARGTCGLRR